MFPAATSPVAVGADESEGWSDTEGVGVPNVEVADTVATSVTARVYWGEDVGQWIVPDGGPLGLPKVVEEGESREDTLGEGVSRGDAEALREAPCEEDAENEGMDREGRGERDTEGEKDPVSKPLTVLFPLEVALGEEDTVPLPVPTPVATEERLLAAVALLTVVTVPLLTDVLVKLPFTGLGDPVDVDVGKEVFDGTEE